MKTEIKRVLKSEFKWMFIRSAIGIGIIAIAQRIEDKQKDE